MYWWVVVCQTAFLGKTRTSSVTALTGIVTVHWWVVVCQTEKGGGSAEMKLA